MKRDGIAAARTAVSQATDRLEAATPAIAFLFATPSHHGELGEIAEVVMRESGASRLVGCLGSGVLSLEADVEGGAGLSLLLVGSDGELRFDPFMIATEGGSAEEGAAAVPRPKEGGEKSILLLLPDAISFQAATFFADLEQERDPLLAVGGGSIGDGSSRGALQLLDTEAEGGRIAGCLISGEYAYTILVGHGCFPASEPYQVTESEGNAVLTLQGEQAATRFLAFVERFRQAGRSDVESLVCVAIARDPTGLRSGDFYVRPIVGLDPKTGAIVLSEPVSSGYSICFALPDPRAAWKQLLADLQQLQTMRSGAPPPSFGLYFNCATRTSRFYGMASLDTTLIKSHLGDFPLGGFYGGAEFAPLAGSNRSNLFSGVLLLVDEVRA